MKKYLLSLLFILLLFNVNAQVSYTVNSGNFYYTPQILTINSGDTVHWMNDGGLHNVNFDINTVTQANYNNPESFSSTPTDSTDMYTHVFTIDGIYEYDCSVGQHAANGMTGTIIVNSTSASLVNLLNTDKSKFKIYNILGNQVLELSNTALIYIYNDGTVEKKIIVK